MFAFPLPLLNSNERRRVLEHLFETEPFFHGL